MKFKVIEKPVSGSETAKEGFISLLNNGEMKDINGGAAEGTCTFSRCGTYTVCSSEGKNSCSPYDCWGFVTDCTATKNWVVAPINPGDWAVVPNPVDTKLP